MCPAVTNVSLFAIAIVFPASIAFSVGKRPTLPKIAFTNTCDSLYVATSINPSSP